MSLLILLLIFCLPLHVLANCITLDIADWTQGQRGFLSHVTAIAANDAVKIRPVNGSTSDVVTVCTPVVDISSITAATLQSAAQAIVDAQSAADTDRQARRTASQIEVQANNLCAASFAEVESRLDAIHDTIQTAIDAIDATGTANKVKTALTLENTRRTAVDKQLAKCLLSRATLQEGN